MLPRSAGPCIIGQMTTVRDLLQEGKHRLSHFEAARLEAEILLARTMGVGRAHLFAHPGQEVAGDIADQYLAAVKRRQHGEPMAYITGEREFWSLPFKVSPAVLIPRPATETLVESALARIPQECSMRIADIGTGSGAIALALAHERPECEIHATDISGAALKVAAENARNLNLGNVHFHSGSWFEPLCGQFDLVVSNPPYLAQDDRHLDEGDLPFEPDSALISGQS